MSRLWTIVLVWILACARAIPLLVYAGVVIWLATLISGRQEVPEPVSRRDVQKSHQLQPGDLTTPAIDRLGGKYLNQDVRAGGRVTEDMVADRPPPAVAANTMAAIITITRSDWDKAAIGSGSDVRICVGGKDFAGVTKVLSVNCGAQDCEVVVGLPRLPNQTVDPVVLSGAMLVDGKVQGCASPRP
ncbi:hypothetical protein [Sinorhizobium sp. BG8]|uniref:hypothetical protein n=1 Tax=Sinorhizobium sp. BG8 TaxID=2613773 RepID=UPI00193C9E80|nr:hypothetical protein [Sinorhizobium sp. BG8]QRM54783.1 hypothetical protein F3Y30_09695 [Sinorhizobium sp. BG8]